MHEHCTAVKAQRELNLKVNSEVNPWCISAIREMEVGGEDRSTSRIGHLDPFMMSTAHMHSSSLKVHQTCIMKSQVDCNHSLH